MRLPPQTPTRQPPVVTGAALLPRYKWAPHGGEPRTEADAQQLASTWGVEVPEDVRLIFRAGLVPDGAYARYGEFYSGKRYRWADLTVQGKIPLKVDPEVLLSDEAIVAVLAHEMHEIEALRAMFEERETIPGAELIELVRPDKPGNLHDEAWDKADRLVRAMRGMP